MTATQPRSHTGAFTFKRVLLVEDEAEMASSLVCAFKQSGFVPDHAPYAATAEALLAPRSSLQDVTRTRPLPIMVFGRV